MAAADDGTDPRYWCGWCDGQGRIARATSEATYPCERCDGTGEEPVCEDCGGEGLVRARAGDRYDEAGMTPCPTCSGP